MKLITKLVVMSILPLLTNAQFVNNKVNFQKNESWEAVLEKAKSEHKNIFIDAYATWCGPCKQMDAIVFTDATVGNLVNENFIAIKVQFDRTSQDDENIKKWYENAETIMKKYNITGFPTSLFISPDGQLLHKAIGYQSVPEFIKTLNIAINDKMNFLGQIARFRQGQMEKDDIMQLALLANEYQRDTLALDIASFYKINVVEKTSPEHLLNPRFLSFIATFPALFKNDDTLVSFLYNHQSLADSLLGNKGYASQFINYVIHRDFINPIIKPGDAYTDKHPNWKLVQQRITATYDDVVAKKTVLSAKIGWYSHWKDWKNAIKFNIEKLDSEGIDTVGFAGSTVNNMVFNVIFLHGKDKAVLKKGIGYMEYLLRGHPDKDSWLDTYANLLFKVGCRKGAIKNEKLALSIAQKRGDVGRIQEYMDNLKKMENGLPTWTLPDANEN